MSKSINVNTTSSTETLFPSVCEHPAWLRLEDQLAWYDRKSQHNQRMYKSLMVLQIVLAVLIPVMTLLPPFYIKLSTSLSGAVIAVVEAIQQLNQYSTLWVTYRSTAEHLKHEKYLFLSGAGPYKDFATDERVIELAERVEEHVSTEHANWFNETKSRDRRRSEQPRVDAK
jgi:hypothetical protein